MNNNNYLSHHGIKGQKWYVRRFQNEDGSLTAAGRERYDVGAPREKGSAKVTFKSRVQSTAKAIGEQSKKFATAVGEKGKQLKEAHEVKKVERAAQAEVKKAEESIEEEIFNEEKKKAVIDSGDPRKILKYQDKLSNQELLDAFNRAQRVKQLKDIDAAVKKDREQRKKDKQERKKERFLHRINNIADKGIKLASTIEKIQNGKKMFSNLFDNFDDLPLNTKIKMAPGLSSDKLAKLATQVNQLNNINTWKNNLTDILEPNKKKVDYSDKTSDDLYKIIREGGHTREEVDEAVRVLAQHGQASENYSKARKAQDDSGSGGGNNQQNQQKSQKQQKQQQTHKDDGKPIPKPEYKEKKAPQHEDDGKPIPKPEYSNYTEKENSDKESYSKISEYWDKDRSKRYFKSERNSKQEKKERLKEVSDYAEKLSKLNAEKAVEQIIETQNRKQYSDEEVSRKATERALEMLDNFMDNPSNEMPQRMSEGERVIRSAMAMLDNFL